MWVGSSSLQHQSGNYQLDQNLLYPPNIIEAPGRGRKANFGEGSGTVSEETISSWSCSEYNLDCKPKAAESYCTHVHTIELRARPLRPFLGDPYEIPLTKAALCASRGTPASDVKNGGKNPLTTPFSHRSKWCNSYLAASLLEIAAQLNSTHHMGH